VLYPLSSSPETIEFNCIHLSKGIEEERREGGKMDSFWDLERTFETM
jgi:hypothetical protein